MKKLVKQIVSLSLVAIAYLSFDLMIYELVTKRCTGTFSNNGKVTAILAKDYLPFAEKSGIVKKESSFTLEGKLPVLDGAAALLPVYSAFAHAVYPEEACIFDGSTYTPESSMQYRNTLEAYKQIVDGGADLVFCASPSKAQLDYAESKGVTLKLTPIAYEAFVFLVNYKNPVDNLSTSEIKDLFSGKIKNWKEVGGADRNVHVLRRIEGSGSQTVLENFLGDVEITKSPYGLFGGALGFSFRYYVEGIVKDDRVKMLSLDGVYPSAENIRSKTYPIVATVYAVTREGESNENVQKMLDWILSSEGQKIIEESGYIPL